MSSSNRGMVNVGTIKAPTPTADNLQSKSSSISPVSKGEYYKNINIDKIEISNGTHILFTSNEAKIQFILKAESLAKMINSILNKYFESNSPTPTQDTSHYEELKNYKTYEGIEEANF